MLNLPRLIVMSALVLLAAPFAGHAQQPPKVARIGYLTLRTAPTYREEAFRQALRALGYVEGQNLVIEYRWAAGKAERLPELAAELVRLKVDVFVTAAVPPVLAARQAGPTTPIVMAAVIDPVASGLVASLARPGGNITGFTVFSSELVGKRLQMLKEAVPRASRFGVLAYRTSTFTEVFLREAEAAAKVLRVQLLPHVVGGPDEIDGAFAAMIKEGVTALLVPISSLFSDHRRRIVELAAKHRLPAIYELNEFAEAGGLMSYGPDVREQYRRAADYVDKILKGAKAGELPIQQPTKFDMVVNLKTAKALRITLPEAILAQATQVIQ